PSIFSACSPQRLNNGRVPSIDFFAAKAKTSRTSASMSVLPAGLQRGSSWTGVACPLVDRIHRLLHLVGPVHRPRSKRNLKLGYRGRTDDVRRHEGTAAYKAVGEKRRIHAEAARKFIVLEKGLRGIRRLIALSAVEQG